MEKEQEPIEQSGSESEAKAQPEAVERGVMPAACTWEQYANGWGESSWKTTCGKEFCLNGDGPKFNSYNYCPNCGGEIKT